MLRLSVRATTSIGVSTASGASARAAAAIHFHPCELVDEIREGSRGGSTQARSTLASPTAAFARAMTSFALFTGAMRKLMSAFAARGRKFSSGHPSRIVGAMVVLKQAAGEGQA